MGVREYFQYDPKGTKLARKTGHRLHGERPEAGRWVPLERPGAERIRSDVLGLELRVRRAETEPGYRELRYRDPLTGNDLPTHREAREQGRKTRARAEAGRGACEAAQARLEAAERRNAELKAMRAEFMGRSDRAIQTARVENPGGTAPRALTQAPYPRGMALFGVGSGRSGIRCWTPVGHPEGRDNLDIRSIHHEYWRSRAWPCRVSPVRPCGGCSTLRAGEFDDSRQASHYEHRLAVRSRLFREARAPFRCCQQLSWIATAIGQWVSSLRRPRDRVSSHIQVQRACACAAQWRASLAWISVPTLDLMEAE